jgi:hypothetical protein
MSGMSCLIAYDVKSSPGQAREFRRIIDEIRAGFACWAENDHQQLGNI